MRKSIWMIEYRCASCCHEMTDGDQFLCNAVCPYCGHRAQGRLITADVTQHAYRNVWDRKWWQFWIGPTREYRDTGQSDD